MILTASGIRRAVDIGDLVIDPFDASAVNPNSYNYRLASTLRVSDEAIVDAGQDNAMSDVQIPEGGLTLVPGTLYLGTTVERIGSSIYVPSLIGRSSVGRLGMFMQLSADMGNLGAVHRWTLEIVVCQPIRVYPLMTIGQVSFWRTSGDRSHSYDGYFGAFSDPVLPTRSHFNNNSGEVRDPYGAGDRKTGGARSHHH